MSIMDRLDGVISRHLELSALMASGDRIVKICGPFARIRGTFADRREGRK